MLDVIVLIAMAVTAAAFAVGLIVQSGIAQIPALIAAGALYLVMAASYLMVARGSRPTASGDRLNEVEAALEIIDKDLQRIDRVEDDVSRLDLLADRVERLDQALGEYAATAPVGGLNRSEAFAREFDEVHARIDTVRADLEGEAKNQRDKITGDLRVLESLIKQLSRELISASTGDAPSPAPVALAETSMPPGPAPIVSRAPEPIVQKIEFDDESDDELEEQVQREIAAEVEDKPAPVAEEETILVVEEEVEIFRLDEDAAVDEEIVETIIAPSVGDGEMLEIVSQAIEAGRVDLYLQPVVTLPDRRLSYFEALTRIRTKAEELILPGSYLQVAETSGMMPLIDNVLLVKSVQTLRRLGSTPASRACFATSRSRPCSIPSSSPSWSSSWKRIAA